MTDNHRPKKRLIKWVGDARSVKPDGFGVGSWKHENNRVIATIKHWRILEKGAGGPFELDPDPRSKSPWKDKKGRPVRHVAGTGISREYVWHYRHTPGFILEVDFEDAKIILALSKGEFKDVTDEPHPEVIVNDVRVVVPKKVKVGYL